MFVDKELLETIKDLVVQLKEIADREKWPAAPPAVLFKENKKGSENMLTDLDDDQDTLEECAISALSRIVNQGIRDVLWAGILCEGYALIEGKVMREPGTKSLEEEFGNNPFTKVTEVVAVCIADNKLRSETIMFPYKRDDFGKTVIGEPYLRSQDPENCDNSNLSSFEQISLRFQEVLLGLRKSNF